MKNQTFSSRTPRGDDGPPAALLDAGPAGVSRSIWALGFVSLFMDMSSEIVHGLLPVFLTITLGASLTTLGLLEGLAEGCVLLFKTLSGPLSDRLGHRKPLALLGYSMGAISKPIFAMAPTIGIAFGARVFDRVGKGIRDAPRDSLVADLSTSDKRGRSYGLRQSLDTIGAVTGPLMAAGLMILLDGQIRLVFWFAALPGLLAVWILFRGVQEKPSTSIPKATESPRKRTMLTPQQVKIFKRGFWIVVMAGFLFQLARFSEAFLILRATEFGLPLNLAPLVLVVMNIFYGISAYPAGRLSDIIPREWLLIAGMIFLIGADLFFAFGTNLTTAGFGCALWGLHMGCSQGILSALIADNSPAELRGTAFGIFNLFSAIALLASSLLAGIVWDQYGSTSTFLTGAILAALSLGLLFGTRLNNNDLRSL